MKIFAAGIATETNTFCPVPTGLADFDVQRGSDVLRGVVQYPALDLTEVWGRQDAQRVHNFVFSLNAWAQPSGTTVRAAYEELRDEMLSDLRRAQPVDVVLLMLHGAMVAHGYDDCEADILRHVREIVGPETVIGVELDLHCHLSEAKIAHADVVITYKEYPHVDINERARELFDLCIAASRHEIKPCKALFDCRMVGMYPTTRQPLRSLVDALSAAERRAGVLSVSFGHGFQFADVPHVGAKVLVITDGDPKLAANVAAELGKQLYDVRDQIGFELVSLGMEIALSRAMASNRVPIVVADQSDNTGGGAPGDATFALRWLLDHGAEDVATAIFYDPEVVRIARRAGVGARLSVRLGGKMSKASGDPLDIEVVVHAIRESYQHSLPQQTGKPWTFPAGDVVALRCGTVDIVVSSLRCQCLSPTVFSDLEIELCRKKILMPKSYQHFYGAFEPIAGEIIYMAASGAVPPDPREMSYRRLDTSRLYPWFNDPLAVTQ